MQEWIGKALVSVVLFVQSLIGTEPLPEALPPQVDLVRHEGTQQVADTKALPPKEETRTKEVQPKPAAAPVTSEAATTPRGKPTCTMLMNGASYSNLPGQMKTIKTGETLTLSWKSTGGEKAYWLIESGDGVGESAPFEGSKTFTVSVNDSGTWHRQLLVRNRYGDAICSFNALLTKGSNANFSPGERTPNADLTVPPPTCTLTADKMQVTPGETVTITWVSTNADYATEPGESGNKPASGSRSYPNMTYTRSYGLTFYGKGGKASCTVVVPTTGYTTPGRG